MGHLRNKSILVGISGGIAAYKVNELVRHFAKEGALVRVVLTENAKQFVTPLTLSTLSGQRVIEDVWQLSENGEVGHVHIGNEASLIVIAPATANTIARLANGFADDALSTLVLSSHCPVLIAPAMETEMWHQALTQRNIEILKATDRFVVLGPDSGALASGKVGLGRMSEPDAIFFKASQLLAPAHFANKKIVVSAGPTREAMDPIRYISNRSSGKMGFAIAALAAERGAEVHLVHGPVAIKVPPGVIAHPVESAVQMLDVLSALTKDADALVMAAAVADFAPKSVAKKKLKKADVGTRIDLKENPDVVKTLAAQKGDTLFVGFAAETHDVEAHALKKLSKKGLDLIVANDVSKPGVGMDADDNRISIYDERGLVLSTEQRPKSEIAEIILNEVRARLAAEPPRTKPPKRSPKGSKSARAR